MAGLSNVLDTIGAGGLTRAHSVLDDFQTATPEEQRATSAATYAKTTGAFGQGITRGVRGLKAGLQNFAGTAAEVAGAPKTAEQFYDEAQQQNQQAQAESPDIPELNQVNSFGSGARYLAGQMGAGLPYVAPSVVGATGATLLGAGERTAAGASIAANVAPMIGGVQERLRADPETAKLPAEQRAAIAAGEGLTDAALYHVVPTAMASKAVGRAASDGILKDTLTSAAGMGAAGAGTEVLGQHVQSALNPDRDTSGDNQATIGAAVGGAAGMIPFALPHAIAGNAIGGVKTAGGKLADAAATPRDWLKERIARSQDPDYSAITTPQTPPTGLTPEAKDAWLQGDDQVRNAAAEKLATQYTTDEETPAPLHNAAMKYLKGPKTADAWKDLTLAAKNDQMVSRVKDGLTDFGSAIGARVSNGIAGAKDALASRENAQTPLVDGSFDSLLADQLLQHTGLTDSTDILTKIPQAVADMKQWVSSGFALSKGGEVTVPRGLDQAFKDPAAATEDAYNLMQKQGLISADPARLKEVLSLIDTSAQTKKTDGSIVEDNLLPTAQAEHSFSGADHVQIAQEVKRMISTGKFDDEALQRLFGKNTETVLEALNKTREKTQEVPAATSPAGEPTTDGEEHSSAEAIDPSVVEARVEHHGPYDSENPNSEAHAKNLEGTLTAAYGRDVKRQGVVDMMREKYAGQPEKFEKTLTDYIAKNKDSLKTDAEKARPDEALNKKHFVLRSEDASDKQDSVDIPGHELNVITPDSASNKWAEKTGKNNEYGDVAHGKLFFERLKYDNKGAIDKTTGEISPSASQFATSTNKLIARMRQAKKEGAFTSDKQGLLDQHDLLRAGISSMLSAKDGEGRPVTSGRVGVVDKPGAPVRWLGTKDALPADLKLPNGSTVGDVKTEAEKGRIASLKDILSPYKSDEAVANALKGNDEKLLRKLADKLVQDGQYDERSKKGTGTSETEEMAAAAEKADKDKVRMFDEATGEEVQPRTRPTEKTYEQVQAKETQQKQVGFLMKTLREKGVPAFSELAKKLSPDQNVAAHDMLSKMIEAKTADNPIWDGDPPKNFDVFGNRARAALARLEGYESKVDGTVAKRFSEEAAAGGPKEKELSDKEKQSIRDDIQKRLGKDVGVDFANSILGSKGTEISGDWQEGLIRISVKAHDPAQVGSHEAMHEFFNRLMNGDKTANRAKDILTKSASSAPVLRQVERLLDGHADALKQIADGAPHAAEERLAYMYQFWHAGLLNIGPETKTTFQKIADFFRRTIGRLTDNQKSERLLQAFDDGKTQTADAVTQVLANNIEYREKLINRGYETIKPIVDRLARFTLPSEAVLMRSGNPHLQEILRDMKNPTGEGVAQSNIEAKGQKMAQYMNRFQSLVDKYEPKDLELAGRYLREGKVPTDRVAKEIYEGIHGILSHMENYMREADVKRFDEDSKKWEDFGHIDNYFPQSYDAAKLVKDPAGFISALLEHHTPELENIAKTANAKQELAAKDSYAAAQTKDATKTITAADVAQGITDRLIMSFGHSDSALNEDTASLGYSPFARAINRRTLDFLDQSKFHDWMNNDITSVVTSYIAQGVKRAEYVRRFGNGGEQLSARMEQAFQFEKDRVATDKPDATKDAIEKEALQNMQGPSKAIMALEGTIGYDIDPRLRRLQGTVMAYENLRTMGLSLFSAVIDPLGLMVRGGEMKDAMAAYSRSLKEVWATWKGVHTTDADAKLAEFLGTVDSGGFLANFGQAYSSMYLHQKVRKWNEALFKWNGMDGFNRGVRIQATQAAISFIKRQATNPTEHSERYLHELTLTKDDVKVDDHGDLDYNNPKMQVAIKRWVDQAILRPNAAHRPTWMSDPHFAVFGHMKQFSYTFHDTIIKRAWMEAKEHSNLAPMAVLLGAFTPMMVAADLAKSILLTGQDPVWMHGGLGGVIDHGARRAGLLGLAQPYADPIISGHPAGIGGPAVDQLYSMFTQPFDASLVDALPGASVLHTMHGGGNLELMTDD